MEGCFMFQWGGLFFRLGLGGCPMGRHQFWWGVFEKKLEDEGGGGFPGLPPFAPPTIGNPEYEVEQPGLFKNPLCPLVIVESYKLPANRG